MFQHQIQKKKIRLMELKLKELGEQDFLDHLMNEPIGKIKVSHKTPYRVEKSLKKAQRLYERDGVRKYALKLAYVGADYFGLESQSNVSETIEAHFFKALKELNLIQSVDECSYNRAGRTDKGVSALGNVVSLKMRQCQNMCININRLLPDDVKVIDSCEVEDSFNARYDCIRRVYKYYFFQETLDVEAMRKASLHFLGDHDFRNYCKINVVANQHFVRTIFNFTIDEVQQPLQPCSQPMFSSDPRLTLYCATIEGNAFLWHQIRCMMQVLFHIGKGKDDTDVVRDLFDLSKERGKPQYELAADHQLVLYDCIYPQHKVEFKGEQSIDFLMHIYSVMKKKLCEDYVKSMFFTQMGMMAFGQRLREIQRESLDQDRGRVVKVSSSLLDRNRGPTPETLVSQLKGKRKGMYDIKMNRLQAYEDRIKQE